METIPEVLKSLDDIILDCKQKQSRIGYFTSLYKKMTLAVQQGILDGIFENNERMVQLDVVFAKRFIDAYWSFKTGETLSQSWYYAFNQANSQLTILQHLLLGINTHINFDLGIAASEISEGQDIHLLQNDFKKINYTISSLLENVQTDLGEVCFPMKFLKRINTKSLDSVINFSIGLARNSAWTHAVTLSSLTNENQLAYTKIMDNTILQIAQKIAHPSFSQSIIIKTIQWFEEKNITKNITFLET